MLEVIDLHAGYGRGDVLREACLRVDQGEVVGLLGANGVGKSTLALSISGLTRISSGTIRFEGQPLNNLKPEAIVDRGLVQVAQGRPIFRDLTVHENLRVGAYPPRGRAAYRTTLEEVEGHFPILAERRAQLAGLLSGGEQQMLLIGRALMARPSLLVLDEPSLGLAPRIISAIFATIRRLNAGGLTVLVAEQNVGHVLSTASRAYILEEGRVGESRATASLREDMRLREAYLGTEPLRR